MYIPHVIFLRSSLGGHLGCLCLNYVNGAAMSTREHVYFQTIILFGCMLRSEIVGSNEIESESEVTQS